MRTEIDPTLTVLSQDLSQDEVMIHYLYGRGERGQVCVGRVFGDCQATLVLTASTVSCEICVQVEQGTLVDGKWHWTTSHVPLEDVYDVQVSSFGDNLDYLEPKPFARWLRSKTGRLVRTNLDV